MPPTKTNFRVNLPPDQEEGHYADFASIWHNKETFVLDFVAMVQPPQIEEVDGAPVASINSRVVTRVRIPASQAWEVMKALENQLTAWEKETGAKHPTPPVDLTGDQGLPPVVE